MDFSWSSDVCHTPTKTKTSSANVDSSSPSAASSSKLSFPKVRTDIGHVKARGHNLTSKKISHVQICKALDCAQCKFIGLKSKWQRNFRISSGGIDLGSWLTEKFSDDGVWVGVGCSACAVTGQDNLAARFELCTSGWLQKCNLQSHAESKQHVAAMTQLLSMPMDSQNASPSKEQFKAVWDDCCAGKALAPGVRDVGERGKVRKLLYCLAEAMRTLDRRAFSDAASIAIHMDGKKHRHGMTYSLVTNSFEVRRGSMGHCNYVKLGGGTQALVKASVNIIRACCTAKRGAPCRRDDGQTLPAPEKLDHVLFAKVIDHVEVVDTDAAPDECAGARILTRSGDGLFQNCKLVIKDHTHGCTRILKRPYDADPYLHETMDRICQSKNSITQKIQHSPWYAERFSNLVKQVENDPCSATSKSIRNLAAAKHRYMSYQTPVSKAVLYIEALLTVAMEVSVERRGRDDAKHIDDWLGWIDNERLLTLALMADAGDEASVFLRFWDNVQYDTSKIGTECAAFVHKIDCLFVRGQCEGVGYTKHMLEFLSTPRLLKFGKTTKSIGRPGGLDRALILRVLCRLRCWVTLAVRVVQAEFPSWEILQSFGVFDLHRGDGVRRWDVDQAGADLKAVGTKQHIDRLAQVFGVDPRALEIQLEDVRPMAAVVFKGTKDIGNMEAWRVVLKRLSTSHITVKDNHPINVLTPVFYRYAAWCGCTTSGQEHVHSTQERTLTPRRGCMSDQLENDGLKLIVDKRVDEVDMVISMAQGIWVELYGPVRLSPKCKRVDAGVPKPARSSAVGPTMKSWLRNRRQAVTRCSDGFVPRSLDDVADTAKRLGATAWTPSHDKEVEFQQRKRKTHFLSSIDSGSMLANETTDQEPHGLSNCSGGPSCLLAVCVWVCVH